jgi:hypothetical protein
MTSVLATNAETAREMRGDSEVPSPTYETTLAITIHAAPEDIWPWLAQLGNGRGGLYSYDWLDRLFGYLDAPSAMQILPQFQQLNVGDAIPLGRGPAFPVAVVDPPRTLVLAGKTDDVQWSWELELRPGGPNQTRLISRNRASMPRSVKRSVFMSMLEPAAFLMTRRMLIGIKQRAEHRKTRTAKDQSRAA